MARTDAVHGYFVIEQPASGAPRILEGCVAVDPTRLVSVDQLPPPLPPATQRDQRYDDMLETHEFPFVVFQAKPVELAAELMSGAPIKSRVPGTLTMHGKTVGVVIDTQEKVVGRDADVAGSFGVHIPDLGMEMPGDPIVQPDVAGCRVVDGRIGDQNPVLAIQDELRRKPYAGVVVSTLPPGLSRWLKSTSSAESGEFSRGASPCPT